MIAKARKIGFWDSSEQKFQPIGWMPRPNAPVFLAASTAETIPATAVGRFPGTTYPVSVDTTNLVTHNTAILGILGVGKTFLGLELVERMVQDGVRVICLDLTDEYTGELEPYVSADWQSLKMTELQELGAAGDATVRKNVEEGGSIQSFADAAKRLLIEFLDPPSDHRLLMVNPE